MDSISKSSEAGIPIATVGSKDTCPKAVLVGTHSTREKPTRRGPDAQDRNSKSKRPCENRRKKAGAASGKTSMEGEARTISARLRNPELWELFHREETEMIITKAGRYVFIQFICFLAKFKVVINSAV